MTWPDVDGVEQGTSGVFNVAPSPQAAGYGEILRGGERRELAPRAGDHVSTELIARSGRSS